MLDRAVVRSVEECFREPHPLVVLLDSASADARPEAFLDLEPNAPRRSRKDLEQLRLIGKMHFLIGGTVSKSKNVVQLSNGFGDSRRAHERAVVGPGIVSSGSANHQQLRRGRFRDLYETIIPSVALHRDV